MSDGDHVTLTLVCVVCGTARAIWVPRKRGVPAGRHLWECLDCQAKGTGVGGAVRPWKKQERQGSKAEPSDREEI